MKSSLLKSIRNDIKNTEKRKLAVLAEKESQKVLA
jgi:hypothetical protein